ncbi:hypothetical protein IGJ48_001503 [Enterococcus pernyi]
MLRISKKKSTLMEIKEFITNEATIEDIIALATIMQMRKNFLEIDKEKWPKKEIEQFITMEASLSDIKELATTMRQRKKSYNLNI